MGKGASGRDVRPDAHLSTAPETATHAHLQTSFALQPILRTQTILRGHLDGDGHVVKGARDEDVEEVAVGRRRDPVRLTSRT